MNILGRWFSNLELLARWPSVAMIEAPFSSAQFTHVRVFFYFSRFSVPSSWLATEYNVDVPVRPMYDMEVHDLLCSCTEWSKVQKYHIPYLRTPSEIAVQSHSVRRSISALKAGKLRGASCACRQSPLVR